MFELAHTDTPAQVAIKEAVDLAAELATDESPAFLNAVLAQAARRLRRPVPAADADASAAEASGRPQAQPQPQQTAPLPASPTTTWADFSTAKSAPVQEISDHSWSEGWADDQQRGKRS